MKKLALPAAALALLLSLGLARAAAPALSLGWYGDACDDAAAQNPGDPAGCRYDASEKDCGNGVDDDSDERTDGLDADCGHGDPVCQNEAAHNAGQIGACAPGADAGHCADGLDNDYDGAYDCSDADCDAAEACRACAAVAEVCDNDLDDDCDGLADGDDPDCGCADAWYEVWQPRCACPKTEVDADGDCAVDSYWWGGACADGADNEGDGTYDCADEDCAADAACGNTGGGNMGGAVTDGTGMGGQNGKTLQELIDEANGAPPLITVVDFCVGKPDGTVVSCTPKAAFPNDPCEENGILLTSETSPHLKLVCDSSAGLDANALGEGIDTPNMKQVQTDAGGDPHCSDGIDNDGDGLTDDADPDCAKEAGDRCFDGLDNDGDSKVDCADPDCSGAAHSTSGKTCGVEKCADGVDNDGDGLVDAEDDDCTDDATSCAAHDARLLALFSRSEALSEQIRQALANRDASPQAVGQAILLSLEGGEGHSNFDPLAAGADELARISQELRGICAEIERTLGIGGLDHCPNLAYDPMEHCS